MDRRDEPAVCQYSAPIAREEQEDCDALFVPEAIPLYHVALRVPAHADVLIAVGGDDVLLVGGEEECGEEGDMPEDELAVRGVFM